MSPDALRRSLVHRVDGCTIDALHTHRSCPDFAEVVNAVLDGEQSRRPQRPQHVERAW